MNILVAVKVPENLLMGHAEFKKKKILSKKKKLRARELLLLLLLSRV